MITTKIRLVGMFIVIAVTLVAYWIYIHKKTDLSDGSIIDYSATNYTWPDTIMLVTYGYNGKNLDSGKQVTTPWHLRLTVPESVHSVNLKVWVAGLVTPPELACTTAVNHRQIKVVHLPASTTIDCSAPVPTK